MVEHTMSPQTLAEIVEQGERTTETRALTKAFLDEIAAFLTKEVGQLEADVGTKAQLDARKIQFIDRAYFYLAPDLRGTYFPLLTVYLFPGRLWWGLHAWGKETFAEEVRTALRDLNLAPDHEIHVGTGAFHADEAWGGGGYVSAGRQLSAAELYERQDVTALAREIAADLAQWWQRLQPQLPALRERLDFAEDVSASPTEEAQELADDVTKGHIASEFDGFSPEAFSFFMGLEENNNQTWLHDNQARYEKYVRETFRSLFKDLGPHLKRSFDPYLVPDSLGIEAKFGQTLATIKKRWPDDEGPYHPYYWGAFYRERFSKQTDAQLFVSIRSDNVRFGFYVGERAKDVNRQFRQRVMEDVEAFYSLVKDLGLIQDFRFMTLNAEGDRQDLQISSAEDLGRWVEGGDYDLLQYLEPGDPIVHSPALADRIFQAMRRVFPVYLWAVAEEHLTEVDRYLADEFPEVDVIDDEPVPEPYSEESFARATYLLPDTIAELHDLIQDKRQLIFFGPPGTGKTFVARELGKLLTGLADPAPERMELVQFHPAYGYEDFVEGIRPESKEYEDRHIVDYPAKAGVFRRFCLNAQRVDGPCVFIIDEVNRGNIPRIFGELMLLLEYRDLDVSLPYSGKRFSIPKNVYIIGTMNTADRSIALVDFALRRRFHFFRFGADPDLYERWLQANPLGIPYMATLYRRLSQEAIDDPNFAIGPSHFMDESLNERKLERVWRRSIMPYLNEYYFDQPAKARRWEWDSDFMVALRRGPHEQ